MTIGDNVKQIMDLWHAIDLDMKLGLANIWFDREQGKLEALEQDVENLELEVLFVLKLVHAEKNKDFLEEHVKKFLRLIHHVKPTMAWQKDLQLELDELA